MALAIIKVTISETKYAIVVPIKYMKTTINKIFFLPYISDKLAQIGVITAPEIKYAVRIQEEVPNEILRSVIISGIAGINIVSAYITMIAIIPSKDKVFQANEDI